MSDEIEINWIILDRYFSGEASAREVAELWRWVGDDPERRELIESSRRIWEEAGVVRARFDVDAARAAIRARMAEAEPAESEPTRPFALRGVRRAASWPLRVAAAITLLLGGAAAWWAVEQQTTRAPAQVAMREYVTQPGERATFQLGDGTSVQLGVASRLRVPADYGAGARNVYLEGQAYFEVTHDEAKPFAVHTPTAVARDLGTRFDVRAYAGEQAVQVVVAEGIVEVGSLAQSPQRAAPPAVLVANQLARVDTSGAIAVQRGVDLNRYLAWTEGRLVFKDTRLRDALPQLNRWFDLDIRLADNSLANRPLTVSLHSQLGDQTLQLLAASLDAQYERAGRVVTLYPLATAR